MALASFSAPRLRRQVGEDPAGLFAGDVAAAGYGGFAGVGGGRRRDEEAGGELFGLPLRLAVARPLPVGEVEARAGVQHVVADGVGDDPPPPVGGERLLDADGVLEDDLADAALETPGDDLEAELGEQRPEVGVVVDALAPGEGPSKLEGAQRGQASERRLPRT